MPNMFSGVKIPKKFGQLIAQRKIVGPKSRNNPSPDMSAKQQADAEIAKIQPQLDQMKVASALAPTLATGGMKTGGKVSVSKSAGRLASVAKKSASKPSKPVMAKKSGGCTTRW